MAKVRSELVEFEQIKVTLEENASSTFELQPEPGEDTLSKRFQRMLHDVNGHPNDVPATKSKPIVVTGFGPLDPHHFHENISSTIMQEFYDKHSGKFHHLSEDIDIVVYPPDTTLQYPGIDCSYEYINGDHFDKWLKQLDARLYIHLGVKYNKDENTNPLYLETSAHNMPVDTWVPDYHRGNNNGEPCVAGAPEVLETAFTKDPHYIQSLISKVSRASIFLHRSTDAGKSLCNFLYYRSLYYASKRDSAKLNVLFIHVPKKLWLRVTTMDIVGVLDDIVDNLLDMLPPSDQEERPVVPGIGPIYVEPGRVPIIKREDNVGPIYIEPGALIIKDEVNDDISPVYVERGMIVSNEERQGFVYTEISPGRKTKKDAIDDRSQQVQYAEVIRHRETIATGDIVEKESHVEYAEIREGVGTLEGRSVVRERRKTKPAAHSHKKQARDSRKRRRQKRNSRQRKHK